MGGCKCTFQDCNLTTATSKKQFPDRETHFFHFPVRDKERCVLWAIYSNNMDFLKLPEKKILNKVICDFHFKENNFMNYKRERLTKTLAIPSIYIVPGTNEEVDLIENPTTWVTENKAMPLPASFSTSNLINLDMADSSTEAESFEAVEEPSKITPLFKKRKIEAPASTSVVRILNKTPGSSEISIQKIVKKLPTVTKTATSPTTNVVKVSNGNYTIRHVPASSSTPKIIKQEILKSPHSIEQEFIVPFSASDNPVEAGPVQLSPVPSTSVVKMEELQPMMIQISEIKELLNKRHSEVPQSPAPARSVKEEPTNISQSQFNKVQLFNGIKRYLSPSMIALLRMELFAAPGREYKKDEKIICQELLQLGEETYNFLNDEWRLRLPAMASVQEWIKLKTNEEDDDAS